MCYDISILIWLGYSFSRVEARNSNLNYLQTQRWEKGLADLQPADQDDSLIPMFEGMVERAFSRSSNLEDIDRVLSLAKPPTPVRAKSAAVGSRISK